MPEPLTASEGDSVKQQWTNGEQSSHPPRSVRPVSGTSLVDSPTLPGPLYKSGKATTIAAGPPESSCLEDPDSASSFCHSLFRHSLVFSAVDDDIVSSISEFRIPGANSFNGGQQRGEGYNTEAQYPRYQLVEQYTNRHGPSPLSKVEGLNRTSSTTTSSKRHSGSSRPLSLPIQSNAVPEESASSLADEKADLKTASTPNTPAPSPTASIATMTAAHGQPPPPAIKMSAGREVLFVFCVAMAHFCTQAGLGQALAPLDFIGDTFDITNPGQSAWFVAGYSLSVGTFILISGRLGDMIGHKRMFVFGWIWFGIWAAFAAFAAYPKHQEWFDICRAMEGIGPAIIMPNGLALFGRAYPPGIKKNIAFSIFGAVAPAGFVTGATFGALFAELLWWPWAFWSFALTCWGFSVLAMLVIPRELNETPVNPPGFDYSGSFLGVVGLILINIAWNNAPMYGWSDPSVFCLLIVGFVVLAGFVWVEKRAVSPILPLNALNSTTLFVLGCVGVGWGAFAVWVFYIFRFLVTVRGYTPLAVAGQFGPTPICGLLASGLTGFMLTHTPISFTMLIAMCAFCLGIIIAATQPVEQTYWAQTFVSMIVMPFGMDMSFPAASLILSNHMPPEHQGLAQSLVNTIVNYSISISLGIAGTVEVNVAKMGPGIDPNDPAFLVKGYRAAFYTAVGLSGMGVLLGAMFFAQSMRREGWKVMDH